MTVCLLMLLMFAIRLGFLKISIRNEKAILANGGKEYGVKISKAITILHIIFYFSSIAEALINKVKLDAIGLFGLGLMVFSISMLFVVTRLLGDIWTVKLMIAHHHQFVDHWLFRTVKHPNYFLNIAPELIGIALLCHAKYTALFVLPFYIVAIYLRIREENHLIQTIIKPNGIRQ